MPDIIGECRGCIFWRQPAGAWTKGQCHKHAPIPVDLGDGHVEERWPRTRGDDFCGDYHHRKGLIPEEVE